MMKYFLLSILIICSQGIIGQKIIFRENFNNVDYVNRKILETGVQLNLDENESDGRGSMFITDKDSLGTIKDRTFSIVIANSVSSGAFLIKNEAITIDGAIELMVEVRDRFQRTWLKIALWQNDKNFETIRSKVILNKSPTSSGIICGTIFYKGRLKEMNRKMIIRNDFYYEQ